MTPDQLTPDFLLTPSTERDAWLKEGLRIAESSTPGPCEARYCADAIPTQCVHFAVVSLSAGYETGRNWRQEDAVFDALAHNHYAALLRALLALPEPKREWSIRWGDYPAHRSERSGPYPSKENAEFWLGKRTNGRIESRIAGTQPGPWEPVREETKDA